MGDGSWELGDWETGRLGDEGTRRLGIVLLPFTLYPLPFPPSPLPFTLYPFPLKPKA